jgi:hypothetical protein
MLLWKELFQKKKTEPWEKQRKNEKTGEGKKETDNGTTGEGQWKGGGGGRENLAFWGPSNDLPRSFVKKKSVSQTGRGRKKCAIMLDN